MSVESSGNREPVYVIAKYEYNASSDQELSLRKNERLRLVDDSKQWWKVENARYQSGFVPSNYVKKEKPSLLNSLKRHVKKKTADMKISHISAPLPPVQSYFSGDHPIGIPNKPFTALVKFAYDPLRQDELQLKKGEYILVIEKSHDGWWKGQSKATGTKGWFPSNYVKEMPYLAESEQLTGPNTLRAASTSPIHYEKTVQALYGYTAQSQDELSFQKDEFLTIFDAPAEGTNWLRARNSHGDTGLVPRNYVQVVVEFTPDLTPGLSAENVSSAEDNVPEEVLEDLGALNLSGNAPSSDPSPAIVYNDFIDRPNLRNKMWYFGRLSRQECDNLLSAYGQDGDFLVRDSETGSKADFSVSLKASPRNKHFRVYVNAVECHLTIGQRRFNGLEEMIRHYEKHAICTNNDGRKLTLMRPLPALRNNV